MTRPNDPELRYRITPEVPTERRVPYWGRWDTLPLEAVNRSHAKDPLPCSTTRITSLISPGRRGRQPGGGGRRRDASLGSVQPTAPSQIRM